MLAFFIRAIIAFSFKLFKPELERNRRATVGVPSAHSPTAAGLTAVSMPMRAFLIVN